MVVLLARVGSHIALQLRHWRLGNFISVYLRTIFLEMRTSKKIWQKCPNVPSLSTLVPTSDVLTHRQCRLQPRAPDFKGPLNSFMHTKMPV